jgi:hypothetical protein
VSAVRLVLDAACRHFGALWINSSHQAQLELVGHRFDGGEVGRGVFLLQLMYQVDAVLRILYQGFVAAPDAGQMNLRASRRQRWRAEGCPARMHQTYTYTITTLLAQIRTLESAFRIGIDIMGVVPVAFVPNADQREFMAGLQDSIPQYLTPTLRRRETVIDDARQSGCSVFSYRPSNSYRAKAQRESKEDYLRLAKFVMKQVSEDRHE